MAGEDLEVGVGGDAIESVKVRCQLAFRSRPALTMPRVAGGTDGAGVQSALPSYRRRGKS